MKAGGSSSLNPHAASYVPLSKREAADVNKESEVGRFGHQLANTFLQGHHQNVSQSHPQSAGASTSQDPKEMPEKPDVDEYFEMDLAYLQMIFPGTSEECLSDFYQANGCDLDRAIENLNHLENRSDDSSDKLPETLDIGDVLESGYVRAPLEAKNATEAGASTSAAKS